MYFPVNRLKNLELFEFIISRIYTLYVRNSDIQIPYSILLWWDNVKFQIPGFKFQIPCMNQTRNPLIFCIIILLLFNFSPGISA